MSRESEVCLACTARKEVGTANESARIMKTAETARRENSIRLGLTQHRLQAAGCHRQSLLALEASAEMVPDDEENYRGSENERGDGIDFGSDAAAQTAPNFQRERVVAADQEEGDRDLVHGERKDEQPCRNERQTEIRQRDEPKSAPRSGAQIERGFFLAAIHFLQAGENFRGGNGDECGAVPKKHKCQATFEASAYREHQHRETSDDAGKNEREQNQAAKQRFAREISAIKSESGEQAENERKNNGSGSDEKAVEDGVPDRPVRGKKLPIPIESEVAWRKAANAVAIKRIDHENRNRQVDESEDQHSVKRKKRRPS